MVDNTTEHNHVRYKCMSTVNTLNAEETLRATLNAQRPLAISTPDVRNSTQQESL